MNTTPTPAEPATYFDPNFTSWLEANGNASALSEAMKGMLYLTWKAGREHGRGDTVIKPAAAEAPEVSPDDERYESEHPAARLLRLEFEAKYGPAAALMRAAHHWFNVRTQYNDAWNRDREQPITLKDVELAEQQMLAAQPKAEAPAVPSDEVVERINAILFSGRVVDTFMIHDLYRAAQPKAEAGTHLLRLALTNIAQCPDVGGAAATKRHMRQMAVDALVADDAVQPKADKHDWLPIVPGMSIKRTEWDAMSVAERRKLMNEAPADPAQEANAGRRSTSTVTAIGHGIPDSTAAKCGEGRCEVANEGDARAESAGCTHQTVDALRQAEAWIADIGKRPGMRAIADIFLNAVIRPALASPVAPPEPTAEAIEDFLSARMTPEGRVPFIRAIREALSHFAAPAQEPVAWLRVKATGGATFEPLCILGKKQPNPDHYKATYRAVVFAAPARGGPLTEEQIDAMPERHAVP